MKLSDKMLFFLLALAAIALPTLGMCAFDLLWAVAALGVVSFWAGLVHRRCNGRYDREFPGRSSSGGRE